MALLPLVEMGTAPPIEPGYDLLLLINRFSHRHVYSNNCSCPIEEHSRTMAVISLSGACKHTVCLPKISVSAVKECSLFNDLEQGNVFLEQQLKERE